MNSEILSVLEYMEKEKGIDRQDMIPAITTAIVNAAQKGIHAGQELLVDINPKTGDITARVAYKIVDSVSDSNQEIHVEKARGLMNEEPVLGEFYYKSVEPSYLGRISAQAARQAIMQRVRQFEKDRIYDDFKDQVGDIVTGVVRRRERGDLIVDVGKAEAILPYRERTPGEEYTAGERIRCLLLKIESGGRGPELILSRSSLRFVRRLLDLEVTEITDGTVAIKSMAREAGYRTKISVDSSDPKVDPVGACVGARGMRVKSIVRELNGEKVDVIRHYDDPTQMLEEAIKPAVPRHVKIDEVSKRISFKVQEEDLSIAIGRKGLNARLTSRLMGWKLDIDKVEEQVENIDQKITHAAESIMNLGIDEDLAQKLVGIGITTPDALDGVDVSDLEDAGLSPDEAQVTVTKFLESRPTT